jgi:hypothetical protein
MAIDTNLDAGLIADRIARGERIHPSEYRAYVASIPMVYAETGEPVPTLAEAFACVHRGAVVRVDEKPPCKGGPQSIYGCAVHGECSIGVYCTAQTVTACTRCADRGVDFCG